MVSELMRLTGHILEALHRWETWTCQEAVGPSRLAIVGRMHLCLLDHLQSFLGWRGLVVSSEASQKVHQLVLEFVVNPWLLATKS